MQKRQIFSSFLFIVILGTFAVPQEKSDIQETSSRIAGLILVGGQTMTTLLTLTDTFGGRLSGSDAYNKAATWAAAQFRAAGLQVRMEPFNLPHGWQRGPTQARALTPTDHVLHIETGGWGPSTPIGGLRGEVVLLEDISPEAVRAQAEKLHGKIVLVDRQSALPDFSFKTLEKLSALPNELKNVGVRGVLLPAALPNNIMSTGDPAWGGEIVPIVFATIGREDAMMLQRWMKKGSVTIEYNQQNQITGPLQANNVVAEIRGREEPDEWVMVGAHLDSWDFASGAQDNGSGVAMVLEAARVLAVLGRAPRRSIRFALWGGEEEGMVGSFSYVKNHATELQNCIALLNTDSGAGHPSGWEVENRKDVAQALKPISKALLEQLGAGEVSEKISFDTDNGPFLLQGIPALDLLTEMSRYDEVHHKMADTIDKVDPHSLATGAAVIAVTAFALADSPQPFAKHLDHAGVAEVLKKDGLDEYLKRLDLWH
jgi:hypothetical protein